MPLVGEHSSSFWSRSYYGPHAWIDSGSHTGSSQFSFCESSCTCVTCTVHLEAPLYPWHRPRHEQIGSVCRTCTAFSLSNSCTFQSWTWSDRCSIGFRAFAQISFLNEKSALILLSFNSLYYHITDLQFAKCSECLQGLDYLFI